MRALQRSANLLQRFERCAASISSADSEWGLHKSKTESSHSSRRYSCNRFEERQSRILCDTWWLMQLFLSQPVCAYAALVDTVRKQSLPMNYLSLLSDELGFRRLVSITPPFSEPTLSATNTTWDVRFGKFSLLLLRWVDTKNVSRHCGGSPVASG